MLTDMEIGEIRFLSLWQPWATLIALGLKRYETRSWGTPYRGKLAIHAAKRPMVRSEVQSILYGIGDGGCTLEQFEQISRILKEPEIAPLGCIVAIADLAQCSLMTTSASDPGIRKLGVDGIISVNQPSPLELSVGNWSAGRFAWKLENVIALPQSLPMKGAQGLRLLNDAEILRAINEQI